MANLNDYFKEYFTDKTRIRANYVKNALYKQRRLAFSEINDEGLLNISSSEELVLFLKWAFFWRHFALSSYLNEMVGFVVRQFPKIYTS